VATVLNTRTKHSPVSHGKDEELLEALSRKMARSDLEELFVGRGLAQAEGH
jgi:hypothetical protein